MFQRIGNIMDATVGFKSCLSNKANCIGKVISNIVEFVLNTLVLNYWINCMKKYVNFLIYLHEYVVISMPEYYLILYTGT